MPSRKPPAAPRSADLSPLVSRSPVPVSTELIDESADDPVDPGEDITDAAGDATVARTESLTAPREAHGQRLDAYLGAQITAFSRSHLKTLIEDGCVSVDGQPMRNASRKVAVGQRIEVVLRPTAQSLAFVAEPMDLAIVFEDAHLLVVNKPAGLVVHPAAGNWQGTLMNGLLAHHRGAASLPRAGIVHRLDKDTSGLMVVGKTLEAVTALSRAIAAREVSRQYLALAHGVADEAFSVETPIGRDPATRVKMAVLASGKPARTDVRRLLSAMWQDPAADSHAPARSISGVLCTLHTGRTHQIRVHLSSRKLPLVADGLYGGAPALGLVRQALHAARLSFVHPVTQQPLAFEASLPHDMAQAWALLEGAVAAASQTRV